MSEDRAQPKTIDGGDFPVKGLEQALAELRRPFTAEAVKWKVQSGTLVVPYIDARLVIERLNLVVGADWMDRYEQAGGGLVCELSIDGVTRLDFSDSYKGKGLYSDAFKRAAVKFGVGVSLYSLKKVFLSFEKKQLEEVTRKGKKYTNLTEKGLGDLRGGYSKWLEQTGENMFGAALDHGDEEDAIGDAEAEQDQAASGGPAEDPEPAKLEDERATDLITEAETLYQALPGTKKRGFTKATFTRQLQAAWHSHEALEDLITKIKERANAS